MSQVALSTTSKLLRDSCAIQQRSLWFVRSALLFRLGLALVTFEQIRPYGVMPSDFCFFLSLLFLKFRPKVRLLKSTGSGVLMAGALILSGALLSLHDASKLNNAMAPLTRLFILFVLFGSLAVIHSENIRKNLLFLIGGIALNCAITLLQAWVFPGIVDMLSINPVAPDTSEIGRFQGLTAHTVTLGLSAALAVLIAVGLISSEKSRPVRGGLLIL